MFNHLTLQSNEKKNITILGQRVGHRDDSHYYFELFAEQELIITMKQSKSTYNIHFHENRTTFQCQHLALDYMSKHNLIECIVNNNLYEKNMPENPIRLDNYNFR